MRVLVEELHSRGHHVTVIWAADSWYISQTSPHYQSVTLNVAFGANDSFFHHFVGEVIKIKRSKGGAWSRFDMELKNNYELHRKICDAIVHMFENKELIHCFLDSKFDLVLTDPANGGRVLLALYLRLPLVFNARWTVHGEAHFAVAPSPLSCIPLPPSELSDKMNFFDRVQNMLFYIKRMQKSMRRRPRWLLGRTNNNSATTQSNRNTDFNIDIKTET